MNNSNAAHKLVQHFDTKTNKCELEKTNVKHKILIIIITPEDTTVSTPAAVRYLT